MKLKIGCCRTAKRVTPFAGAKAETLFSAAESGVKKQGGSTCEGLVH